ncbi:MAG: AMP-binding protein [Actinomycetota bacterium]|nr:AMP-binding protein [Actinomycetota bacterium]
MPDRPLARIPVPPGADGVVALIEPLRRALDGTGPAIAPIPIVSATTSNEYVSQLLRATRPADSSQPLESDEIAVVMATSGSTQNPKGVMHSASTLTALTRAALGPVNSVPQWIAALPVTSMGGINVLIRSSGTGLDPIAVSSVGGAAPFTPKAFNEAFVAALIRSPDVRVSLVAAQLRRLLADPAAAAALQQCSQILIGGGPLPLQTAEAARAAKVDLTTTYGATETAGGCVFNGHPLAGVDIAIDEHDAQIILSGPMVALGYRCEPELTARQFVNGAYLTGDTGIFAKLLSVTGRLDDVATINGVNVSVHAVEEGLNSHAAVHSCAVMIETDGSGDTQLFAAITLGQVEVDAEELKTQLRAAIRQNLGTAAVPRFFAILESLPMLPNGKVDRRVLKGLIGDGATWQR